MKKFIAELTDFLQKTANDERIPERDKKVLLAMVALIISPVDIIPDWIPVFGLLDDRVLFSLILDYFFSVLDQSILLSHYPWGMKSFARLQKIARFTSMFVPSAVKNHIWKYTREPF